MKPIQFTTLTERMGADLSLEQLHAVKVDQNAVDSNGYVLVEAANGDEVATYAQGSGIRADRLVAICSDPKGLPGGCLWISPNSIGHPRTLELLKAWTGHSEAEQSQALLAQISHDMRSPLSVISTAASLAERNCRGNQKAERYLHLIEESAGALKSLVNDILDYSKMRAGQLAFVNSEFSLHQLAHSVTDSFSILVKNPQQLEVACRIAPDTPEFVVGDPGRLRQVLTNLLSNAMKFTERGHVRLHIATDSEDPKLLKFSIEDTGVGIKEEAQERIFAPYQQADNQVQSVYGGTGLGLTICRLLVEIMGGKLWLKSTYGVGSTFLFTANLPEVEREVQIDLPELKGTRVFLAHKSPKLLSERLAADNSFTVCESLDDALSSLKSSDGYDLFVIDLELNGFDLPRKILESRSDARVVVTTSAGQRGEVALCREMGLAGYLTTELSDEELNLALALSLKSPDVVTRYTAREMLEARAANS